VIAAEAIEVGLGALFFVLVVASIALFVRNRRTKRLGHGPEGGRSSNAARPEPIPAWLRARDAKGRAPKRRNDMDSFASGGMFGDHRLHPTRLSPARPDPH
jgi:hypothetical protein